MHQRSVNLLQNFAATCVIRRQLPEPSFVLPGDTPNDVLDVLLRLAVQLGVSYVKCVKCKTYIKHTT